MLLAISLTAPATWLLDLLCRFSHRSQRILSTCDQASWRGAFQKRRCRRRRLQPRGAVWDERAKATGGGRFRHRSAPVACLSSVSCSIYIQVRRLSCQKKRESFVFCCSTGLLLRDSAAGCLRGPRVEWPRRLHVHCVGSKLRRAWPSPPTPGGKSCIDG